MAPENRHIALASIANLRDLGGIPTHEGAVRPGQFFRSATLAKTQSDDAAALTSLRIQTVYDLRTRGERVQDPDKVTDGTRMVALDVLADRKDDAAAGMNALINNPAMLSDVLVSGRAEQAMLDSYRDIIRLPSALASYRAMFLDLLRENREGAALVHCTTGKDRTGWAAASFLLLLGADRDFVRADYLQTNTDLLPAMRPLIDRAVAQGVPEEPLLQVLGVQEAYLDAALAEVDERWGSVTGYAREGLGLEERQLSDLRRRFVG